MTIWTRISDFVADTAGTALGGVIESVRTVFEGDPETRRRVAFSVAMIALSAKMAKADGIVTPEEVEAFEEIFAVPPEEHRQVERLYNLAKQDVAGFEAYATQLAQLCGSGERDCPMLGDILEGLFHIAKADGVIHENEQEFLRAVTEIFDISDQRFEQILARHTDQGSEDPYRILGIDRDLPYDQARRHYLALVRENHPDAMAGRGVPIEFLKIASDRIARINRAWDLVEPQMKSAIHR